VELGSHITFWNSNIRDTGGGGAVCGYKFNWAWLFSALDINGSPIKIQVA
jgi:hypothetical protein